MREYGSEYYTYSVDFTDEYGIFRFYSYYDGSSKLMKIYYTLEEGVVTLGKINEVHITYEDVVDSTATGDNSFSKGDSDDFTTDSGEFATDSDENFSADVAGTTPTSSDLDVTTVATTAATVTEVKEEPTSAEFASNTGKESTVNEGEMTTQVTSPASFTDSERAELETLKKEKKIALISKYEEYLTDEEKADLTSRVDEFTEETLELELLKIYKKSSEESFSRVAPLAAPEPKKPETADTQLNSYIRRMLGK